VDDARAQAGSVSKGRAREPEPKGLGATGTLSILSMQLQIGDRYTDEAGEWEVVSRPVSFRGGKSVRARVQVPGRPDTEREDTWEAHQRITVRRG
jgi:hypothetical protein